MYVDPIVEEIHQIREQHCEQFQFDLHRIFADVKQRERASDHKVVNLSAPGTPGGSHRERDSALAPARAGMPANRER